ncbi:conserved exported hypothetical protein [Flavobacterium sp. 9AF]|uniref:hypothetical protein n=1 Tax=Flavobacterium sp. 9AF TaxID=2653142 RepID=UPI0012EF13E5|nr:hypothetical protein [Flavobacterium sp. 9AF]VXA98235.1 conserved exported hypothetical protein [Flavobacterium sp. 9AF]
MKKTIALLLFLITCVTFSQKSAPVMGDAAILIDLLRKDYSTINPDTRLEEINTDREKVIAIFKSYLKDTKKETLQVNTSINDELIKSDTGYTNAQKAFNSFSKNNITINNDYKIDTVKDDLKTIQDDLQNSRINYFNKKYAFDFNYLEKIKTLYGSDNPYLVEVITLFKDKYEKLNKNQIDYLAQYNYQSSVQKSLPFIGGDLAFETIIDGLSRFLAKRIKEELTLHAIDKIRTYLENPTPENYSQELTVILPKTTNYLKRFNANQLLNFTNELKQYIEQDLNTILENTKNLRDLPKIQYYIKDKPDLEFAFDGLEVLSQLSKIKNPVDYFELLENSRALVNWRNNPENKDKYNIAQSLRLASMLAYSLTVVDNGEQKFASIDFISNYGNETNFYFLYFGFLHQQNLKYFTVDFRKKDNSISKLDIKNIMSVLTVDAIKSGIKDFYFIKDNMISVVKYAEKIHTTAQSIKKKNKNNETIAYIEIHDFIKDILGFTEEVVATADLLLKNDYGVIALPNNLDYDFKQKLIPYFSISSSANDLVLDLHEKKYANAVIKAIEIPLWLKNTEQEVKVNLYKTKILLEGQMDLVTISKSFDPEINNDAIKELKNPLKIISLKLSDNINLNDLKKSLDILCEKEKVSDFKEALKNVKNEIKKNRTNVLIHFGINTEKIKTEIIQYLKDKGQSETVQKYFASKLDTYTESLFTTKIFHEEDNTLTIERELNDLFIAFIPDYINNNDVLKDTQALKIIHFINDISLASNAEDVEKAIDAFALPVGSSSLKESATSYYSINSFPGIIGGFEFSEDQDTAYNIGFTAPIGFYIQPWCSGIKGGTFGLFIPVIDIAAPVRLRLDDEKDTETLPDFNFNDIFSPGLYGVYGFRNSPFTINLGFQYGPKLRDIPNGTNDFISVDSYRLNLGITIDIPLLTLSGKYKD